MAKYFSFCAEDVALPSQNFRPSHIVAALGASLIAAYSRKRKAGAFPLPRNSSNWLTVDLAVKAFYVHKSRDKKDADNISKPLWDSLNKLVYADDKHIRYLETLKVDTRVVDSCEFDITNLDDEDLQDLTDFLFNPANTADKLLYIEVCDLDLTKIRM